MDEVELGHDHFGRLHREGGVHEGAVVRAFSQAAGDTEDVDLAAHGCSPQWSLANPAHDAGQAGSPGGLPGGKCTQGRVRGELFQTGRAIRVRIGRMSPTTGQDALRRVDERRMAVWQSFLKAHAGVAVALNKELEEEREMPVGWYSVLLNLSQAPDGKVRMQDLAEAVLLSFSGMTRLFDRMETSGLVKRKACSEDRRGIFAVITPEGREAFKNAAPVHIRGIHEHFARHLTDDEVAVLEAALGRIVAASVPGSPHGCDEAE
ncbi:MAG: MarR family transcriptional regulator [Dehalococcoidia bacterium]|nr:MarR family transcriptional regulator [Dehalococcoidia bacterium]